jgi:hypothetical protein
MKLKKGSYTIGLDGGEIDLFDLVNNPQELEYLAKIREDLALTGLHKRVSSTEFDVLSAAALIYYIDELCILLDDSETNKNHH